MGQTAAMPAEVSGRTMPLHSPAIRTRRMLGRGAIYFALVFMSLIYILPFWWMAITSFKEISEVYAYPPTWWPHTFTLTGYTTAWTYMNWPLHLLNTMTIMAGVVIGVVISSTLCAYGFARLRFPGRDVVFVIMLASMMLPSQVTIIPSYILFHALGWLGTFKPLIIPAWFGGGAFNIFLMRQFFTSVPVDLVDAARIDGASRLRTWWKIMLPLSKPALTAITVFTIQGVWNDFFGPLIYLNRQDKMTLALALQVFQTVAGSIQLQSMYQNISLFTALMAASTVVTLPMIILFIVAQKYFVEGIQLTGLKG